MNDRPPLTDVTKKSRLESVLTQGEWKGGIPWKFIVAKPQERPPLMELCTAAFCIVTYQKQIVLIEHANRGIEFPGGHIEENEEITKTIQREMLEEAGTIVTDVQYFGYKQVSPTAPIPHRDNPQRFYPFPHSYVPYYFAQANEVLHIPLASDVKNVHLVSYDQARKLLAKEQNHEVILQYLINAQLIEVV